MKTKEIIVKYRTKLASNNPKLNNTFGSSEMMASYLCVDLTVSLVFVLMWWILPLHCGVCWWQVTGWSALFCLSAAAEVGLSSGNTLHTCAFLSTLAGTRLSLSAHPCLLGGCSCSLRGRSYHLRWFLIPMLIRAGPYFHHSQHANSYCIRYMSHWHGPNVQWANSYRK